MGFGECFLKNKALLIEGSLGERLKQISVMIRKHIVVNPLDACS